MMLAEARKVESRHREDLSTDVSRRKTDVSPAKKRFSDSSISTRDSASSSPQHAIVWQPRKQQQQQQQQRGNLKWSENSPHNATPLQGKKPNNTTNPKPKDTKWNRNKGKGLPSPDDSNSTRQPSQQQQQQQQPKGQGKNKGSGKGRGHHATERRKDNKKHPVDKIVTRDVMEFNWFVARRKTEPALMSPRLLSPKESKQNDFNSRRVSLPEITLGEKLHKSVCKPGEVAGYIKAMTKLRRDLASSDASCMSPRGCLSPLNVSTLGVPPPPSPFTASRCTTTNSFCTAASCSPRDGIGRWSSFQVGPTPFSQRKENVEMARIMSSKVDTQRKFSSSSVGSPATKTPKGPAGNSLGFRRFRSSNVVEVEICAPATKTPKGPAGNSLGFRRLRMST